MVDPTEAQLKTAARQRLAAARQVIDPAHAPRPQDACYLLHVAIECALKYRILETAHGPKRISQLKEVLTDQKYRQLFASSEGHNLELLVGYSCLKRFLQANGQQELLTGAAWKKMCKADRPYSLRYGTEQVALQDANVALELANELLKLVLGA
jgi:HEPN domain-containing protein